MREGKEKAKKQKYWYVCVCVCVCLCDAMFAVFQMSVQAHCQFFSHQS